MSFWDNAFIFKDLNGLAVYSQSALEMLKKKSKTMENSLSHSAASSGHDSVWQITEDIIL